MTTDGILSSMVTSPDSSLFNLFSPVPAVNEKKGVGPDVLTKTVASGISAKKKPPTKPQMADHQNPKKRVSIFFNLFISS